VEILRSDCFLTTTSYRQVGKVLAGSLKESAFDLERSIAQMFEECNPKKGGATSSPDNMSGVSVAENL
jgi:hypothetical protein